MVKTRTFRNTGKCNSNIEAMQSEGNTTVQYNLSKNRVPGKQCEVPGSMNPSSKKIASKVIGVEGTIVDKSVLGKCNRNLGQVLHKSCHTSDLQSQGVNNPLCDTINHQANQLGNNDSCAEVHNTEVSFVETNGDNNSHKTKRDNNTHMVWANDVYETGQYNDNIERTPPKVEDYALLFDIDNNGLDSHVFHAVLKKNTWKKFDDILQHNCADFSAWKSQSDFQFGFVPLSNLVVSSNQGHIGGKVLDPIAQHFAVKAYGVPNFLGARKYCLILTIMALTLMCFMLF